MKAKQLLISLTLGLGLTLVLLWLLGGVTLPTAHAAPSQCPDQRPLLQAGDVITVCLSGGCDYASIQAAVDAAAPGDEIRVAAGTYTGISARGGVTQVVYISKTVAIRGGYNAEFSAWDPDTYSTTLDAQEQGRVLYITGNISPTIEGLRITGGNATWLGGALGYDAGGGVYVISATAVISGNKVFSNTAGGIGGGLLLWSSVATLTNNTVSANTAREGGGLSLNYGDAMLISNTIAANTAEWYGGGLEVVSCTATLTNNNIISNVSASGGTGGGGLYAKDSNVMFTNNTVASNTAIFGGGGLLLIGGDATLSGNAVTSNTAERGGGLFLEYGDVMLVNNVVADNQANSQGSGLYVRGSSPRLLHTTIARNSGGDGGGIYVTDVWPWQPQTVALTNTILVSHGVGISVTGGNTVTVNGVLWYSTPVTVSQATTATVTLQNQHEGNPAFAADGYHLTGDSAAINQGLNAGVTTDIDGQIRDAIPDLGADEFVGVTPIYLPLIMRQYQ